MVKKKYSYTKKGKYYSYPKINKMLSQYNKAKFSTTIALKWMSLDLGGYCLKPAYNPAINNPLITMASLFGTCAAYEPYRGLYSAYKVRGILMETLPYGDSASYVSNGNTYIPWNGLVAIGLFTGGSGNDQEQLLANRKQFTEIIDSDKGLVLDTKNRQRKYCPLQNFDFVNFPVDPYPNVIPFCPLVLHCNYQIYTDNNYVIRPEWMIKITFYVTLKDKVL